MDIHRARFVPYQPSTINTLAFSHTTGRALHGQPLKLAVGRANGDIEIWNPLRGNWLQETVIRGGQGRTCQGLVWTHDPDTIVETSGGGGSQDSRKRTVYGRSRLFSIGYSSTIVEWDLCTGLPRRESSGTGGEVWCLAAQPSVERKTKSRSNKEKQARKQKQNTQEASQAAPRNEKPDDSEMDNLQQHQYLVAGCADGTLVLLSTEDDDLVFSKYIARASKKNARAISICFQDRYTVVAGFSDSTIRVYDIRNGKLLRNMSLGGGPAGAPKDKLVWTVECLKDGTIVSGDSSGETVFWDGRTYGILQRIKGHEADVLCLATSEDGQTVFSSGLDRKTCVYNLTGSPGQRRLWSKTTHRRFHQHDVKAMARFDSAKMSVVVSGGVDTSLMLVPLRDFGKENHRALPFVPQMAPLCSAGRLIASWQDNEVKIWRINKRKAAVEEYGDEPDYHVAARLVLKSEEHISTVSLSANAQILAIGTAACIRLFRLRPGKARALKIRAIDVPPALAKSGARLVQFSPDSRWLLAITEHNHIRLARLEVVEGLKQSFNIFPHLLTVKRISRELDVQNSFNGSWGHYDRTISRCAFSSDSRTLAVSDLAGYTDTFALEGEETDGPAIGTRSHEKAIQAPLSPPSSDLDDDSDSASDISMSSESRIRGSKHPQEIHNQHWRLHPASRLMPRTSAAPIVLSFRPNGIPTASAPHNKHPTPEDRLLILTATHELLEFSTSEGKLTDWSRRNPSALLPPQFKLQRDRALGCIWDVQSKTPSTQSRERLWLYGPTWLCMFDLSRDFPRPDPSALANGASTEENDAALIATTRDDSKKRKRMHVSTALDTKRHNTGAAGSRIPAHEQAGAVGVLRQKTGEGDWSVVHPDRRGNIGGEQGSDDDGDIDPHDEIALLTMPVGAGEETSGGDGTDGEVQPTSGNEEEGTMTRREQRAAGWRNKKPKTPGYTAMDGRFYITQKYRPILGCVPLQSENDVLEVALVERPFWDLKLAPRLEGREYPEK